MTPADFWAKVDRTPGHGPDGHCWVWGGVLNQDGYGRPWLHGRFWLAHRFAYEALVDVVPPGLEIDHLCAVRSCVNVAHMEPVTHTENVRRGMAGAWQLAKTHCPKGHAYDSANTYQARGGGRVCKRCQADYNSIWKRAKTKQLREAKVGRPE